LKQSGVKTEMHTIEGAGHLQAAANIEALEKAYEFLKGELQSRTASEEAKPVK
jgi:dipeptidyl aminopeptidase/acylaminoacyl peptidase